MATSFLISENQIVLCQGESADIVLKIKDNKNKDVNLEDSIVYFTVKNSPEDSQFLIQKTSNNIVQIELTSPREGIATIFISSNDTRTMDPKDYYFDVWVTLSNGKSYPAIRPSFFTIQTSVTKLPN